MGYRVRRVKLSDNAENHTASLPGGGQ